MGQCINIIRLYFKSSFTLASNKPSRIRARTEQRSFWAQGEEKKSLVGTGLAGVIHMITPTPESANDGDGKLARVNVICQTDSIVDW